ncbi:MAG TPA: alpha/beta hydrolase [Actinomycetota bacterium]|nr:alpha/beta hydrolase [Actinomycetota bacterium]
MRARRIATAARIVALAVIGVVLVGLVILRFDSGDDRVSVPAGARAGQLTTHTCTYPTEAGALPADCGTLVVKENRADPASRLIALPVVRIHAKSPHPGDPIFRMEGGPGITNMTFPQASRFVGRHDVVLVGYRGVDGSSQLDCPEVTSAMSHSEDFLAASSFRAVAGAFRECASRLRGDGVDLAGYTLGQRTDDFEDARRALGYAKVDLLSESAGTRTAMVFAWRHPASIDRSVMVGVNPPGHYLWDPVTTDAQIERYSELCAQDATCRSRTADLAGTMRAEAAQIPDHWFVFPISPGIVRIGSFFGLMDASQASPISAPQTIGAWLAAANGDPSGFWLQSLMGRLIFPTRVWGEAAATAQEDASAAGAYFAQGHPGSILGNAGSEFMWADGGLADAWPAGPGDEGYAHVQPSSVPTLLIGGTLDFATPANFATDELLPALANGHQVVLPNFGHTTDFWYQQQDAGTHLVSGFFDSGAVDTSGYVHQSIEFGRGPSQGMLAKIVLGSIVGLAALAVVGLLLVGLKYRRGGFRGRGGAWVRTLGPVLFGLGGWSLGIVLVMTLWPGLPITDRIFTVAAIGVPVWFGVFAGWARRDMPGRTVHAGFWLVAAGALAGGWLGVVAVAMPLAVFTAIAGSAAGANLALILFDISRERSAGGTSAAATPLEVGEPEPALR